MESAPFTVLVTGASSGIGRSFAVAWAGRGARLVLVARGLDGLRETERLCKQAGAPAVHAIASDLGQTGAVKGLHAALLDLGVHVDLVVNNAGISTQGNLVDVPPEKSLATVRLNVDALVEMTATFLPSMLERRRGGFIQIGSTTSFYPVPGQAIYAASKAFVLSFSEAIRHETRGTGVHVLALCPGPTESGFFKAMGRDVVFKKMPTDALVRFGMKAWDRRKQTAIPGLRNNFESGILPRLLPRRLLTNLVGLLASKAYA